MRHIGTHLAHLGILLLSNGALGQQDMFLKKYRTQIQNYIMTGHAGGWQGCDTLSENAFSTDGTPHISMDLDKVNDMMIKSALASSQCLLVSYTVDNVADLQALLNFGWKAIDYIRIALVLKMGSNVTLDMPSNTTKLPFLVAAELGQDIEQFLCPVVGEITPRLEQTMCKPSFASYENKTLHIAQLGITPDFIFTRNKQLDGVNIRLMKILEDKLHFSARIVIPRSYNDADNMVSTRHYDRMILYSTAYKSNCI